MDSNAVFAILLLVVGLLILMTEVFIPSGGLLGVTTFLTLIFSLVFAYRAWGTSHPNVFWAFSVLLLLLVPVVLVFGFYMLPRTSFGKKVLLEAPEAQDLNPYLKETKRLEKLVGHYGTALTMLSPGGLVSVDGERLHALTDGLLVDQGASIEVIGVQGTGVLVRPGTPPATHADQHSESDDGDASPLDFEFPTNA